MVERLVVATRLRYPVVGDLARSIRYEAYERPLIEAARGDVYADVREQLSSWPPDPGPQEYAERIQALVDSPEPLIRLLAEQLTSNGPGLGAMLEAMTRRYYRVRALEDVQAFTRGRQAVRHRQFRTVRRPAGTDLDASPTTTTCRRLCCP